MRDDVQVNRDDQLRELLASEPYWTAKAMQEQGSRFYRALGTALDAADAVNRRRIYETWTGGVGLLRARKTARSAGGRSAVSLA